MDHHKFITNGRTYNTRHTPVGGMLYAKGSHEGNHDQI